MLTYVDLSRLGEDLHRSQRGRRAHEGRRKKNLRFRCSSLLQGKLLFVFSGGKGDGAGRVESEPTISMQQRTIRLILAVTVSVTSTYVYETR